MTNCIIFPSDPFDARKVNPEFEEEANIVTSLGGKFALIDHDELENGNFSGRRLLTVQQASDYDNFIGTAEELKALQDAFPSVAPYDTKAFYRGWMMAPDSYQLMRHNLGLRSVDMKSDTSDYMSSYWLAHWYHHFRDVTPKSTYFPADYTPEQYLPIVKEDIRNGPYIVKDQVKSRKHEWDTACFSPSRKELPNIINEFIRLQGDSLNGGIVVRQFEDFDKSVGEMRVWWVNGKLAMVSPHPDTPHLFTDIDLSFVEPYVKSFRRPFVTTDITLLTDGTPRVVEVSDGQVSGIPKGFDATRLFQALLTA